MKASHRSYFPKSKAIRVAHIRSVFNDKEFKAEYNRILKLPSRERLKRYWKLAFDWGIEVTDPDIYENEKDYIDNPDRLLHQYAVEYPYLIYGGTRAEYETIRITVDIDISKEEFDRVWDKILQIKRDNNLPPVRRQQSSYSDLAYAVSRAKSTGLSMKEIHQQLLKQTLSGYSKKLAKRFSDEVNGLGSLKDFFEKNYAAKTYDQFYQEIQDQD